MTARPPSLVAVQEEHPSRHGSGTPSGHLDAQGGSASQESGDPLNRETPLRCLAGPRTPDGAFYRRSNLGIPRLDPRNWTLTLDGAVERALTVAISDLEAMARCSLPVTLECAGNGRGLMRPPPPGTPWGLGAVSTAEFRGVRLRDLLELARPASGAVEVLFEGADRAPGNQGEPFARSLPLPTAIQDSVLLAWEMNGRLLAPEHGFPLRLVVPGWYGMASVKWLTRIRVLTEPFSGPFQGERYVYRGERGVPDETPVTRMRVRAVIASPLDGAALARGPVEIEGAAWSGSAPVQRVEVSTDGGVSWREARLRPPDSPFAASPWSLAWHPGEPGEYLLLARARDAAGDEQPLAPRWNALGYGNNCVQRVRVRIV